MRLVAVVRGQVGVAMQLAMQYRLDFLLNAGMAVFWLAWTLVPLLVVFGHRPEIGGWDVNRAMVVMGFFIALKGVLDGVISPNLTQVVEQIRAGTLDFVLLKPVDAQLLVSLGRVDAARVVELGGGLVLVTVACARLGHVPSAAQVGACALLFAGSVALLYSLWLMAVSMAFWFVRVDNLSYLFAAVFDAARWPNVVFRGWLRAALTYVLPVLLMTSWPALALTGELTLQNGVGGLGVAAAFAVGSRLVWRFALRHYTSASS